MKGFYLLFFIIFLFSCNNNDEDDISWNSLETALSDLYDGNIDSYINKVDSLDLLTIGRNTLKNALKQKYEGTSESDSVLFELEDADYLNSDTVVIKFEVVFDKDTSFCIQKMVKNNNEWKIKLL